MFNIVTLKDVQKLTLSMWSRRLNMIFFFSSKLGVECSSSQIPDKDLLRLFSDYLKYIERNLRVLDRYRFPETYLVQYTFESLKRASTRDLLINSKWLPFLLKQKNEVSSKVSQNAYIIIVRETFCVPDHSSIFAKFIKKSVRNSYFIIMCPVTNSHLWPSG